MAVSNIPDKDLTSGKQELPHTVKTMLVMARNVMASLIDVLAQAKKAGMKTNYATLSHNGHRVLAIVFALPEHDVMVKDGKFWIDDRAITDPQAWDDLRDVMAEVEK